MSGQRIYNVSPRLVGSIAGWSGMDAEGGKSWLVERAKDLGFNAIWFNPVHETTALPTVNHEQKPVEGSIYAIRDYFRLGHETSAGKGEQHDDAHMKHFNRQAAENGIRVYADLVFNHVAGDHPLVLQETRDIDHLRAKHHHTWPVYAHGQVAALGYHDETGAVKEYGLKFCRDEHMQVLNIGMTTGYDTAQVNYASKAAKEFFVTGRSGEDGYWKQAVDWHLDKGITGFRCDIAYKLPADWWSEIIGHTRAKNPDVKFIAETLGGREEFIEAMAHIKVPDGKGGMRPGFDEAMASTFWWDFKNSWIAKDEHPRLMRMSKYGGAGSPDNHDTPHTLAGNFKELFNSLTRRDEAVANACMRDYAVAMLACGSGYMQMGYEYCKEKQNTVFRGEVMPEHWHELVAERAGKGHALDISDRVRKLNELKKSLDVENCYIQYRDISTFQQGQLIKMHVEYIDADTKAKKADLVLLLNDKPEFGPVHLHDRHVLHGVEGMERHGAAHVVEDVVVYHKAVSTVAPMAAHHARPAAKKVLAV